VKLRDVLVLIKPVSKNPNRKGFGLRNCFVACGAVAEDAGQIGCLSDSALDPEFHTRDDVSFTRDAVIHTRDACSAPTMMCFASPCPTGTPPMSQWYTAHVPLGHRPCPTGTPQCPTVSHWYTKVSH
jgi:hypothetical protein